MRGRKDRGAARVVVIKRSSWSERKRFNLAHELGHMVVAPSGGVDEEKAAHRFAGAFLMPADALRAKVGRFERLCYRALAERIISESRAVELSGISIREFDAWLDHQVTA